MRIVRNRWLIVALIVGVLAVAFFAFRMFQKSKQGPQYQTQMVERGTIVSAVSASGQVVSANNLTVTTSASGLVAAVYVKNGDTVVAGQKIMDIELDLPGQIRQAQVWSSYLSARNALASAQQGKISLQATIESDKSKLITAQLNAAGTDNYDPSDKNKQKLDAERRSSELILQSDQQKLSGADLPIQKAQSDLNAAWISYQVASGSILAPAAGTVSDLIFTNGMVINAASSNSSATSSQKVLSLKSNGSPVVSLNVAEADAGKIKAGLKATVTFDSLPGKIFTGVVVGIDKTGVISSGVANFQATVKTDTLVDNIFTNMSATANIILETKNDILVVPSAAVQTQNGKSTVRVRREGRVETVSVEVGLSSGLEVEIISGIYEGDEVVIGTLSKGTTQGSSSPFSVFGGGRGFSGGAVLRRD